ncbi:unnamed protein product [Lactuca virosa]|uniref:Uncharacterized protein n=1 Tax=Lactuca virosa TaxID=75947 RepID=A0AAU9MJA1_9ASTR|nr:unnamed protein product [Lactuca virosa]
MWVGLPLMSLTDRYLFPLRFLEQSGKGSAEGCSEFISNGHEIREESGNGHNYSWVSWGWANYASGSFQRVREFSDQRRRRRCCRRMMRTKHYCIIWSLRIIPRHLSKLEILKHNGKGSKSIIHYKEAEGFFWININIQEAHLTDHLSNVDCCWFTVAKGGHLLGNRLMVIRSGEFQEQYSVEDVCFFEVVHLQLISTRKKERGKSKNLHPYRVTKRLIVQTSVLKNK